MGGFGSGYHRDKRPTVETARRLTLAEAHAVGIELVFQSMPRNRRRKMGLCPKCKRPARMFYQIGERAACRACSGLTYRSSQEQRKPARILAQDEQPPTLRAGLRALETWQKMPRQNPKDYSLAMATFEALAIVDGQPQPAAPAADQQLRSAQIAEQDVDDATAMLSQLRAAIKDTPADSAQLPKLVNAYCILGGFRRVSAKLLDDLNRGRATDGDRLTLLEIIEAQMSRDDDERYRKLQGIALDAKADRLALRQNP